jgi:small subunit ribosomal protein S2
MLTNKQTIGERIKHLKDLETRMAAGALDAKYNKLEVQRFQEEIDQMNFLYGGIKDLAARPGAVLVVDVINEANALREARKLGLKTIAIADTNVDPTDIDFPIPANDDAIKTIELIMSYVKQAIEEGKSKQKATKSADKTEGDK